MRARSNTCQCVGKCGCKSPSAVVELRGREGGMAEASVNARGSNSHPLLHTPVVQCDARLPFVGIQCIPALGIYVIIHSLHTLSTAG